MYILRNSRKGKLDNEPSFFLLVFVCFLWTSPSHLKQAGRRKRTASRDGFPLTSRGLLCVAPPAGECWTRPGLMATSCASFLSFFCIYICNELSNKINNEGVKQTKRPTVTFLNEGLRGRVANVSSFPVCARSWPWRRSRWTLRSRGCSFFEVCSRVLLWGRVESFWFFFFTFSRCLFSLCCFSFCGVRSPSVRRYVCMHTLYAYMMRANFLNAFDTKRHKHRKWSMRGYRPEVFFSCLHSFWL